MAQQRPRQLHARHAIHDLGLDRHQMLEVELMRDLEQRPVAMTPLAFGSVKGPGGITREPRVPFGCSTRLRARCE
jgi:hypothetical protein